MRKYSYFFLLLLLSNFNFAFAAPTIGDVAGTLANLTAGVGQFFMVLLFSLAFGFFIGALIKYKVHRDTPAQVTISVPITLIVVSLVFLGLGLLMYFSPAYILGLQNTPGSGIYGTTNVD